MIPSRFPIARYKLQFIVSETIFLPTYAGSTLRGAFGQSLRRIACMTKLKDCKGCPLYYSCPYTQIFETPVPESHHLQKFSQVPNAYIIEPPSWGERTYQKGEVLSFELVLFGNLLEKLALIIFVFQRAFEYRIAQGKAKLNAVYQQNNLLQWQDIWENQILQPLDNEITIPDNLPTNMNIEVQTPLRIQENGQPLREHNIKVERFLLTLAKRISLLNEFHQNSLNLNFSQLKEEITEVKDIKFLEWRDWHRYSSRQKQKMALGGVMGEWQFSNLSENWQKLIYLGQWLHCGKNATFGLGKYKITNL